MATVWKADVLKAELWLKPFRLTSSMHLKQSADWLSPHAYLTLARLVRLTDKVDSVVLVDIYACPAFIA